jgi:hypothetical protein
VKRTQRLKTKNFILTKIRKLNLRAQVAWRLALTVYWTLEAIPRESFATSTRLQPWSQAIIKLNKSARFWATPKVVWCSIKFAQSWFKSLITEIMLTMMRLHTTLVCNLLSGWPSWEAPYKIWWCLSLILKKQTPQLTFQMSSTFSSINQRRSSRYVIPKIWKMKKTKSVS